MLCRNLGFTCFADRERRRAVEVFAGALAHGGYLVAGRTQSLPAGSEEFFETAFPREKIFRRR
ncbi:MAG: hypothetical protein M1550_00225 [Deltaproteobacteria bacterium]|nr:hypothetical protein [Deltaproteobacteria bacterium]